MSNVFAQLNNTKGRITINGLDVAIENPAYTYRKSTDKTGQQWSCLMQAHYGYINGYKGNDGDNVDVFVGSIPENDTAYIINQKTQGGFFDEHKVMLGFLSQQQAVDTYQHCFERGWTGLMSVVPCTMSQLKWWLANGDKSRPVTRERLPYAGLERLDSVVWGGTDDANLYSHGGQLSKLLYQIRLDDANNQALEPLAYHDMIAELGNQGFMYENYDALIVEYNKLERKAKQLLMVMQGAADTVKPVGVTVSKPLTKNGVSNVIAWFEMDDGQAVGVFFHNPDKNPKRLDPTDEMISYKWVLNKKDITIAVAPENGKDVIIRTVAKRIMQLVEKNHDRFAKANSDKAELNQKEQSLGQLVIEKQSQLDMLNSDIEALEAKKAANVAVAGGQQDLLAGDNQNDKEDVYSKDFDAGLIAGVEKKIIAGGWLKSKESGRWFSRDMKFSLGMTNNGGRKIASYLLMLAISDDLDGVRTFTDIKGGNDELFFGKYSKNPNMTADEIYEFIASRITQAEQVVEPTTQERPSNWRTNLANARAVAKSLGIETKGKKLERLIKDIDFFDENEMKKQVLAEFKALASRLVLPTGYAIDLKDAEQSIDNAWMNPQAWIKKQGKVDKANEIRVELRVNPSAFYISNSVHVYAENQDTKKAFDKFDYQRYGDVAGENSNQKTPKEIVEKMEDFLTKVIFPEIEYQKVKNSTTLDTVDLPSLGVANIESIGDENIYIEKDGKYYISKVGNTEDYALGEWDFAEYPEGMPATAAPVTQPEQPASEPTMTDFALVTFNAWKKGGKHRIYLKVSENDNAFNEMDYGANDLGYLEVVGKNGSEKINNLSTVSNYSKLKDKVIGSAFISALQEYLSQKDIDISDFNGATLKVEIKSDADVLTEKQAAIDAQANADAQEKKAQQDKADLQQAIIKENIAKFGRDAVVNDLSDAVLGNNAKVDAILAGTLLMSDKDFNSFLSFQKSAEPTMTNPDRDYLQSIIDGEADLSKRDDVETKLTDISERLDAELEPMFEQAAEAFAQYAIAQAATV